MNNVILIKGPVVRSRKISGGRWLVYSLRDYEIRDQFNNRKPIDIVNSYEEAYSYVQDLDSIEEVIKWPVLTMKD